MILQRTWSRNEERSTYDTSVLSVETVMASNRISTAVKQASLSSTTVKVVQKNWTSSLAITSSGDWSRSYKEM